MDKDIWQMVDEFKRDRFVDKIFVFEDSQNEINIAKLLCVENSPVGIESYNLQGEMTGTMSFGKYGDKGFYLSEIYTYKQFRGRAIASHLNEIMDFALKDFDGYLITGNFFPMQRESDGVCSQKELLKRAKNFYRSTKFKIDCKNNTLNKTISKKKKYPFKKLDDIYVHEKVYEKLNNYDYVNEL